jgi:hypothetical protein
MNINNKILKNSSIIDDTTLKRSFIEDLDLFLCNTCLSTDEQETLIKMVELA